jgi:hypothetical protein
MSNAKAQSPNRRIAGPHSEGGWQVASPGGSRASVRTDTQKEAVDRAKEIVGNLPGGGEVSIQGRDGKIRQAITVPPGNDPCPPKDKA